MTPETAAPAPSLFDLLVAPQLVHPIAHFLLYGGAGTRKSTFAASCPWPLLLFCFDPIDKLPPYFRAGRIGALITSGDLMGYPEGTFFNAFGTPVIPVWAPDADAVIMLIEHYVDSDPYRPDAYARYDRRIKSADARPGGFRAEARRYGTVAWDSTTFFGLARRKWDEFVLNATSRAGNKQDGKQWWGAEASAIENEIIRRAATLQTNVCVTAHISDEKVDAEGHTIFLPAAPGRIPQRLPPGFGECYRTYIKGVGPAGRPALQTEPDLLYQACTQIRPPDGCEPNYWALWPPPEAA